MSVASPALPAPWWTQKRWWIGILLMLVTAIGSIDRQVLAFTARTIKAQFALSNSQYGELGFAFLLMYGVGQLFSGVLVDRFGTRRALAAAVVLWSIAVMAHAAAVGFWTLFIARALLGLMEGPNLPAAFKAVAEWFPRAERSMATGLVTAGTGLGLIIAPLLAGVLSAVFGWRAAFIVPGIAGLVWVAFWLRNYELPEHHATVSDAERAIALQDRVGSAAALTNLRQRFALWGHYLRYRQTWGLMLARFVGDGAFYFFAFWLPLYLQTERGFSVLSGTLIATLPFLCADLGSLGGGWLGQRLIRSGWSVDRSRKTLIWAGSLTSLLAWPVAAVPQWWQALMLAGIAIMGIQIKTASLFPLAADIYPAPHVATVWGLSGAVGAVGAALVQVAIGLLVDGFGYNAAFAVASLLCLGQALMITLFIARVEPLQTGSG